jgi:hypothetical protein
MIRRRTGSLEIGEETETLSDYKPTSKLQKVVQKVGRGSPELSRENTK